MPPKRDRGTRSWCWTFNNYNDEGIQRCKDVVCRYTIFGKEVAPTTGTPHLQGYTYFKEALNLKAVRALYPGCDMTACNGSAESNIKYCSKGADTFELGERPSQGKRTDVLEIKELIDAGGSIGDCYEEHFSTMTRIYKCARDYQLCRIKPRSEPPNVIWIYGPAGCGKTRQVYDEHGVDNVYSKVDGWYDGYVGQPVFLIDDFDEYTMGTKELLRLLDRYPYQGRVKGSFVNINSPIIYITSDKHPSRFWNLGNDLNQVMRRITKVIDLTFCDTNVVPQKCVGNNEPHIDFMNPDSYL